MARATCPYGLDLGMRSGIGDDWLRLGPAKVLSDGSLIGRSAFMCCDYQHDADERKATADSCSSRRGTARGGSSAPTAPVGRSPSTPSATRHWTW